MTTAQTLLLIDRVCQEFHCLPSEAVRLIDERVRDRPMMTGRRFTCFFVFCGWHCWSLGVHVDVVSPHVQVHVPFGWLHLGWIGTWEPHADKARHWWLCPWDPDRRHW